MIDIYYKSNLYSYRRTNNKSFWIGIKKGDELDGIFCGNFITVKSSVNFEFLLSTTTNFVISSNCLIASLL